MRLILIIRLLFLQVEQAQTWNLCKFIKSQAGQFFVSYFGSGTPYAGTFPNANLVTYNPNDTSYAYFISNSTGFYLNGGSLSQYNNLVAVYNPAQIIIPVPFTYNSTYSGYSRIEIDTMLNGDSARIILHTDILMQGDGYGMLILPTGSVPNTLRIRKTKVETDSIWLKVPFVGWTLNPPAKANY